MSRRNHRVLLGNIDFLQHLSQCIPHALQSYFDFIITEVPEADPHMAVILTADIKLTAGRDNHILFQHTAAEGFRADPIGQFDP